jgi:hypothetical protein
MGRRPTRFKLSLDVFSRAPSTEAGGVTCLLRVASGHGPASEVHAALGERRTCPNRPALPLLRGQHVPCRLVWSAVESELCGWPPFPCTHLHWLALCSPRPVAIMLPAATSILRHCVSRRASHLQSQRSASGCALPGQRSSTPLRYPRPTFFDPSMSRGSR